MRKWNAMISAAVFVLFLVHGIAGALILTGFYNGGSLFLRGITYVMMALIVLHALIGIKLTADTLIAMKKSGVSYARGNRLFWTRRISGLALMILIALHAVQFMHTGMPVRLAYFGTPQLIFSILFVVSLAVHIISNITAQRISFGLRSGREYLADLCFVTSILLVLMAAAYAIYYIRWQW